MSDFASSQTTNRKDCELPRRVRVSEVVRGRYEPGKKPLSWDERAAGIEEIKTSAGEKVLIYSTGGQATPAPGWELLLMKPSSEANTFHWTLYGLS